MMPTSKIPFPFAGLAFGYPTIPLLPSGGASKVKGVQFVKTDASVSELQEMLAYKNLELSASFDLLDDSEVVITKNPNGGFPLYSSTATTSASGSAVLTWKFKFDEWGFGLGSQIYRGSYFDQNTILEIDSGTKCRTHSTEIEFVTIVTSDQKGGSYTQRGKQKWKGTPAEIFSLYARDAKGNLYVAFGITAGVGNPTSSGSLEPAISFVIYTGVLSKWKQNIGGFKGPRIHKTTETSTFLKTPISINYYNYYYPISAYNGGNSEYQRDSGGLRVSLSNATLKVL